MRIGRVESLQITDDGVNAVASITSKVRIPANAVVHVSALSPAGEQYINFEAASDAGPYLHDGSRIALTTPPFRSAWRGCWATPTGCCPRSIPTRSS